MKNLHLILLSFIISWGLLAFNLASPSQPVFDERCYLEAARAFIAGAPTTNPVHPPTAKYFMALGIQVLGDNPWGWRIPSTLFGALALSMMLAWVLELTGSKTAAIAAAAILAFNNFWFVMSRVAMLSIFSFALSIVGLYCYTAGRNKNVTWLFAMSGAVLGFAISCRWNAVVVLGIVGLLSFKNLTRILYLAGSAVAAYFVSFLPLIIRQHDRISSIIDMNLFMWHFHRYESISSGNPHYALPWYKWIFQTEPLGTLDYLVANPVVTFAGLLALIVALYYKEYVPVAVCIGSIALWASPLRAYEYYYYYLDAFSFLAPVIAIACFRFGQSNKLQFKPEIGIVGLTLAGFIYRYGAMTGLPAHWDFTLYNYSALLK
jgi:dolichyl-phosphate-mannose-protein mannosyltransferase